MKKVLLSTALVCLGLVNTASFAEKVIITGKPVILTQDQDGNVYNLPTDYTPSGSYYYVSINGTNKVCYAEPQTTLSSLTPTTITVKVSGSQVKWNCYDYDENYFTVTP